MPALRQAFHQQEYLDLAAREPALGVDVRDGEEEEFTAETQRRGARKWLHRTDLSRLRASAVRVFCHPVERCVREMACVAGRARKRSTWRRWRRMRALNSCVAGGERRLAMRVVSPLWKT